MTAAAAEGGTRGRVAGTRHVLVIDDHPLIAIALVGALREAGLDAHKCELDVDQVAGAVSPGTLVLLDLDLGVDPNGHRVDGTALVPALQSAGGTVLMVTGSSDVEAIAAAVAAGAVGWIPKSASFEQVLATIVRVAAGGTAITDAERDRLLSLHESRSRESRQLDRRWERLTPRELQVLQRLVDGQRAAAIAEEFVVSMATVRTQIRSILAKLEVGSQLEAVAVARQRG